MLRKTKKVINTNCCLWVSAARILFWTDWDATFPRIEAASMSGGGRHIVFKDMEIGAWPNGLTLDHLEKRIVWTDARYTIRVFMLCAEAFTAFITCIKYLYLNMYDIICCEGFTIPCVKVFS